MAGPQQYILPFGAAQNELLAFCALLRNRDLGLTAGRAEGVVQLLERLILAGNDLSEVDGKVLVKASVMFLAARCTRRATVSERTIRNWTESGKLLGLLTVDCQAQKFGGNRWNIYTIHVDRVREILQPSEPKQMPKSRSPPPHSSGGNGRKRPEMVSAPGPEIFSAPGAENFSAPTPCRTQETLTTTAHPSVVVVSAFGNLSGEETGSERHPASASSRAQATTVAAGDGWTERATILHESHGMSDAEFALRRARERGLSVEDVDQLTERYLADRAKPGSRVTIGYLYRWLTGASKPPDLQSQLRATGRASKRESAEEQQRKIEEFHAARAGNALWREQGGSMVQMRNELLEQQRRGHCFESSSEAAFLREPGRWGIDDESSKRNR